MYNPPNTTSSKAGVKIYRYTYIFYIYNDPVKFTLTKTTGALFQSVHPDPSSDQRHLDARTAGFTRGTTLQLHPGSHRVPGPSHSVLVSVSNILEEDQ